MIIFAFLRPTPNCRPRWCTGAAGDKRGKRVREESEGRVKRVRRKREMDMPSIKKKGSEKPVIY